MNFHNEEQVWCTHPCDNCDMFYLQYFHLTDPVHFGTQYNRNKAWTPNTSKMKIVKYVAVVQCWVIMFNTEKNIFFRLADFQFWDYHPLQETTGDRKIINKQHLFDKHDLNKKNHLSISTSALNAKQCFRMLWNKPICVSCFGNTILGRHK